MMLLTPDLNKDYPIAVRANGVKISDRSNKQYWDASSGAIASNIGHGNSHVIQAAIQQLNEMQFSYRTQFSNEQALLLSSRLCKLLNQSAAVFVNSGSEAVETAVRIAQSYWKLSGYPAKTKIMSRRISYHALLILHFAYPGMVRAAGSLRVH